MPRIVVACACLLVGACSFDANYSGATIYCSDDKCPSGLSCETDGQGAKVCREPRRDAAVDVTDSRDAQDARQQALTCNDPGIIPMTGGTVTGTTANRPLGNSITTTCNGSMMLGYDAVYRLDNVGAGMQVNVSISAMGWTGAAAYIIQPCATNTNCIGNIYAQPNASVNITTVAAGVPYVVVDSTLSGTNGQYTLSVSVL